MFSYYTTRRCHDLYGINANTINTGCHAPLSFHATYITSQPGYNVVAVFLSQVRLSRSANPTR